MLKNFRFELGRYKVLLHHNPEPGTEKIDNNCIKLKMAYEDTSFAIFCTYAPSDGKDTEFLHKIRRAQLDSEETHSAILGDLNCTIDPDMDRV